MKGMIAPLSPKEENTFRRMHFGPEGHLDPLHVRRLEQLDLIEREAGSWRLTAMGIHRYEKLADTDGSSQSAQ